MKNIRLEGVAEALAQSRKIVITNHTQPDGDAMGSALAMLEVLRKMGKEAVVIVPNPYPNFLNHLPSNDEVLVYSNGKKAADAHIAAADLIIHLDYNALSRSAEMASALMQATAKKLMIDHHRDPEDWPDFIYSDTEMSSTCQMVYEFCEQQGLLSYLNKAAAECLYTGIVTDTGSFRFPATTARTHQVAAALLDLGVAPHLSHERLFDSQPIARLKLLGTMLEQMEVSADGTMCLLYLSREQCDQLGYEKGITEGFVNYGLSVAGVQLTCFLREEPGICKISLRSKGDLDVNMISRAHFNGGGHKNAAGGRLDLAISSALAHTKKALQWN